MALKGFAELYMIENISFYFGITAIGGSSIEIFYLNDNRHSHGQAG